MTQCLAIPDFDVFSDAVSHWPGFVFLGSPGRNGNRGRYQIVSALPRRQRLITARDIGPGDSATDFLNRCGISLPTGQDAPEEADAPFTGGLVGLLFYEAGLVTQPRLDHPTLGASVPLCWLGDYRWAGVRDSLSGESRLYIRSDCVPTTRAAILERLHLARPQSLEGFELTTSFQADQPPADYHRRIARVQAYLQAGDCYQVNLSQRFQARFRGSTWAAFKQLCHEFPVPYAAYLNTACGQVLSLSPEQFLGIENDAVVTRPIKGTRPRGQDERSDRQLVRELIRSEKDRAENLMIVDLLRNDLGRICRTGSVRTEELFGLQSYANVHHLVSTVRGTLMPGLSPWEALVSCFPGGSITGAPKVRAMQIIRELEPHRRGPYCGSVFYLGADGRLDSNIAIRTLFAQGERLFCWGGGGVVMDSQPDQEYAESLVKVERLMGCLESTGVGGFTRRHRSGGEIPFAETQKLVP